MLRILCAMTLLAGMAGSAAAQYDPRGYRQDSEYLNWKRAYRESGGRIPPFHQYRRGGSARTQPNTPDFLEWKRAYRESGGRVPPYNEYRRGGYQTQPNTPDFLEWKRAYRESGGRVPPYRPSY